jgi:7-cyano-7-deazaguanine synthase
MAGREALVVLSGGQDSTTCLFWALEHYDMVRALTFNYGQLHSIEINAARIVAKMAGVDSLDHEILDVGPVLDGASPLTNLGEDLEQYPDWQSLPGGLEKTFVPARNALFMVLAANRAYCHGIIDVVLGVCEEDFGGYPDCRESFVSAMTHAMQHALSLSMNEPMANLQFHTPLMHMTKAQSIELAQDLPGCMEALAYSHTAYDGKYPPTGHDHATLLRAKGFEEAGVADPLVVRAVAEGLMELPATPNYGGHE